MRPCTLKVPRMLRPSTRVSDVHLVITADWLAGQVNLMSLRLVRLLTLRLVRLSPGDLMPHLSSYFRARLVQHVPSNTHFSWLILVRSQPHCYLLAVVWEKAACL